MGQNEKYSEMRKKPMEYRKVFDTIPEQFDKFRPRYSAELFEYFIREAGIGTETKVLEIGPGTGQATDPILDTGCDYNAIELGEHLYEKMKEKYDTRPNFHMIRMIEEIRQYVIDRSEAYRRESEDHYDFWNEHIRYVYQEAVGLAQIYHADKTVVSLGALLHDIALIEKAGDKKDHHLYGKILSNEILNRFSCPEEIKERVLGCVLHHRSAKNAENIEELCVCDADILAHFDNIPMLFNSAFNVHGVPLSEVREWMKNAFEKDYQDLSDRTKELFSERYHQIIDAGSLKMNRKSSMG